jgi:hypothetical protein
VVDPAVSPQYGFYRSYQVMPTTELDTTALDWVNGHVVKTVVADLVCGHYLIFSRYRSGTLNRDGIVTRNPQDMPSVPEPDHALFVRSNTFISTSMNQINIVYTNGRDVLEMSEVGR